ncbi:unnamed protein product [Schistosoma mattheei]|uniref:Uncharacterized protein n=1 Tax=Schistosoma mattheei TaxID=31246 RepID=A0A183Q738_9TREM|nr:unnamed protein product [Schistosoma mattheei]
MANDPKKCIIKRGRDTSHSTRSVDAKVDVELPQISSGSIDLHGPTKERRSIKKSVRNKNLRKEVSSIPRLPDGSEHEMPRKPNHKAVCFCQEKQKPDYPSRR